MFVDDIDDYLNRNCEVYDIDSFNAEFTGTSDLFIVNFNVRSYNANVDEFIGYINNLCRIPDIIVLTETWFSNSYTDCLDGFNCHHCVRTASRGGGGLNICQA
jgi:hypothetical protein